MEKERPRKWHESKIAPYQETQIQTLKTWGMVDETIDPSSLTMGQARKLIKCTLMKMTAKFIDKFPEGTLVKFYDQPAVYEISHYILGKVGNIRLIYFRSEDGILHQKGPTSLLNMRVIGSEAVVVQHRKDLRRSIERCVGPFINKLYEQLLIDDLLTEKRKLVETILKQFHSQSSSDDVAIEAVTKRELQRSYQINLT